MPDGCKLQCMGLVLAQRHTSTCKRTKSTGLCISAHELSRVIQTFGNLNSVALGTFTHDSPPTIKASKVLSEDHSFCKRLKPCTQAPLFVNGSIPMRQARPGKIDCQPSREGSYLMDENSNAWESRLAQRHTSTCKRTKSTGLSISAHELSLAIQAFGFRAYGLPLTRGSNFYVQDSSHQKSRRPPLGTCGLIGRMNCPALALQQASGVLVEHHGHVGVELQDGGGDARGHGAGEGVAYDLGLCGAIGHEE